MARVLSSIYPHSGLFGHNTALCYLFPGTPCTAAELLESSPAPWIAGAGRARLAGTGLKDIAPRGALELRQTRV